MYALVKNGAPEELVLRDGWIVDENGTQHLPDILRLWTADKLAAVGVYKTVDDEIPEGKKVTGYSFEFTGSAVLRHFMLEDADPPPVPQVVSRFQARAALLQAGMLHLVEAAIEQQPIIVRMAWNEVTEFRRDSATLNSICGELGMSQEQIDDLFRAAAQISI